MADKNTSGLLVKIALLGALLAFLAYLFHPATGHFSMTINGEPVADPLARSAVLPAFIGVLVFTVFLGMLVMLGVGTLILILFLVFGIAGIGLMAPYLWPLLVIILLVYLLASLGRGKDKTS